MHAELELEEVSLTNFMPLVSFNTPRNHQKSSGFLILSGGIKRDQWHENGLIKLKFHKMVILLIILRKSCEWLKNNCCKIILHKISRVINLDHMVYDQISYLPHPLPPPPSTPIHLDLRRYKLLIV